MTAGSAARRRRRGEPARVRVDRAVTLPIGPSGAGLVITVNAAGGSADEELVAELRTGLPDAEIVELDDPSDLADALRAAAARVGTAALGAVGGDGTLNAAAAVAREVGLPLVPVPGGTLNHLARDLGLCDVADVVAAVAAGSGLLLDLPTIAGRPFLNTAAFGAYPDLVDAREAREGRIGKWPAMVVAMGRVLRAGTPIEVEVDGEARRLWMIFAGSCHYEPDGFAPSRRPRLDDGELDVRWIDAGHPWARTRLVLGLVTGRLGRSPIYRQWSPKELHVVSLGEPLRLARDGETFDGGEDVVVRNDGTTVVLACAPQVVERI